VFADDGSRGLSYQLKKMKPLLVVEKGHCLLTEKATGLIYTINQITAMG